MKKTLSACAAALCAFAASAHAGNLVQNGDFTQLSNGVGQLDNTTVATGWSTTGYNYAIKSADVGANGQYGTLSLWDDSNGGNNSWNGKSAHGGNFLAMDGDFQTGPVEQTITGLTVNKTYHLTFSYAFGQQTGFSGATVQSLAASIGGTTWDSGDVNVANHGFTGWQNVTIPFTATSASEVLSFLATGNLPVPPFAMVSNVSIPATGGVPEPATWAMMVLGLGVVGGVTRARRATTLVAI